MIEVNSYSIVTNKIKEPLKIALAPDLHDIRYEHIIKIINEVRPDLIAIAGDLVNSYTRSKSRGMEFLAECSKIVPTFYSTGNHEMRIGGIPFEDIESAGAIYVDNKFVSFRDLFIGGFPTNGDLNFLNSFSNQSGFKILLSHHPEHYKKYHRMRDIDLILSGHAHGGQIRIFGQGLYSPGQGIFPRLTSGVYENRLVVSRGLCNSRKIPRLWNKPEIVFVDILASS